MTDRTSFVYYVEWANLLLNYPDDLRLKIDDAIKRYVLFGEEPTDAAVKFSIFGLIRGQIDRDFEKWQNIKKKRSEAGAKGAEAANAGKSRQKSANPAVNDNVNVNVNVNEDEYVSSFLEDKAKKISFNFVSSDFSEVFATWLKYKRQRGEQYTPAQAKAFYSRLTQLSSGDPAKARQIVEQAMCGNYPTIVQLNPNSNYADNIANHRPSPAENIRAAQEAHLRDLAEFIGAAKANGR